jgi:hypothetical protein
MTDFSQSQIYFVVAALVRDILPELQAAYGAGLS